MSLYGLVSLAFCAHVKPVPDERCCQGLLPARVEELGPLSIPVEPRQVLGLHLRYPLLTQTCISLFLFGDVHLLVDVPRSAARPVLQAGLKTKLTHEMRYFKTAHVSFPTTHSDVSMSNSEDVFTSVSEPQSFLPFPVLLASLSVPVWCACVRGNP